MSFNLNQHRPGCTPVELCHHCKILGALKESMEEYQYKQVFSALEQTGMMLDLEEHAEGCKPHSPCANCMLARKIQDFMPSGSFKAFVELYSDQNAHIELSSEERLLNLPVSELGELSVRTLNVLKNEEVNTIRELVELTEAAFLRLHGIGRKSLNELKYLLAERGLAFRSPG